MSDETNLMGINYVRPPQLKFNKIHDTSNYTEYDVVTYKDAKTPAESDDNIDKVFTNDIDSLIYCNETLKIKVPKKKFMKKGKKAKFAYAFGMFPNPKNYEASYLDGCILGALGLKRQGTLADVICFITPDISMKDKQKLDVVFDKVIYVPYITPYKMAGSGDYIVEGEDGRKHCPVSDFKKGQTLTEGKNVKLKGGESVKILWRAAQGDNLDPIMMDPDIFKNCPNYNKEHPYSHVFFKIHIFNPKLFDYEKVCFVDSDLVPMNYFDSLFMLDTPAGWVEYRKKFPFQKSLHWDRCDYLEHGKPIPKIFTDTGTKGASDVNAGLMVISPNKDEYESMINQLTSPTKDWLGPGKEHIGFYDMELDNEKSLEGRKFVDSSYCYPEQNYLTKRFSGKWTYIEYSFQSWSLDPCNSFGIHMAAFNPKPWFKQPANSEIKGQPGYNAYFDPDIFVSNIPKAVVPDNELLVLENISISYELFNDLIIWGIVNYSGLIAFFLDKTKIYGTKLSFGEDKFKPLSDKHEFKFIRDITQKDPDYKKLSISQQYITNLLNNYNNFRKKVKDKYLSICHTKTKDRYGEFVFDNMIIKYPDHIDKSKSDINTEEKITLLKQGKIHVGKFLGKKVNDLTEKQAKQYTETRDFFLNKKFRDLFIASKYSYLVKSRGNYAKINKSKRKKKRTIKKRVKRRTKRLTKKFTKKLKGGTVPELLYFKMDGCNYCDEFEKKLWPEIKDLINSREINGPKQPALAKEYGIKSYPTLVKIDGTSDPTIFSGERTLQNIRVFLK